MITSSIQNGSIPQPNKLIILAEDNDQSAEITREILEMWGYRVVVTQDGLETLAAVESEKPALILMDWHMPKMDGLEATKKLKNNPDTSNIKIIFLTAFAMKIEVEACMSNGAVAHMSKPIEFTQLKRLIEKHLSDDTNISTKDSCR